MKCIQEGDPRIPRPLLMMNIPSTNLINANPLLVSGLMISPRVFAVLSRKKRQADKSWQATKSWSRENHSLNRKESVWIVEVGAKEAEPRSKIEQRCGVEDPAGSQVGREEVTSVLMVRAHFLAS